MRIRLIFLLVLFVIPCGIAVAGSNDSTTSYYDETWKKIEDPAKAFFYRKAILKNGLWLVNDYFAKNSQLQMSGSIKEGKDSLEHGFFTYYYSNGLKKNEGEYINGNKEGEWNSWYESGKKNSTGKYKEGYWVGQFESWYDDGRVYCKANYLNDIEKVKSSEKTDSLGRKIKVEGLLDGEMLVYYSNGQMSAREYWKDGLKSMECWDEQGKSMPPTTDPAGQLVSEQLPVFTGDVSKYLVKNINYPKEARKRNEEGRTVLVFVVDREGNVDRVKVAKSSGSYALDDEAARVVWAMSGKWKPGRQHNIPVNVYYTLPISFKLSGSDSVERKKERQMRKQKKEMEQEKSASE